MNVEFGSVEAARREVDTYAPAFGQLPAFLMTGAREVEIHDGDELFGGNTHNGTFHIHSDAGRTYIRDGFLEEVLIHEAAHVSLDRVHAMTPAWRAAQEADAGRRRVCFDLRPGPSGPGRLRREPSPVVRRPPPLRTAGRREPDRNPGTDPEPAGLLRPATLVTLPRARPMSSLDIRRAFRRSLTVCMEFGANATFSLVPLAQARERALANRRVARSGGDPRPAARRAPGVPTFDEAVATVLAIHSAAWKAGGGNANSWQTTLREYACPQLGGKGVDRITTADVMAVLLPSGRASTPPCSRAEGAPAHRHGHEVGHRARLPERQSGGRRADGGVAEAVRGGAAPTRASACRGRRRGRGGVRLDRVDRREARLRVSGPDRGAVGGGAPGDMGRDRPGHAWSGRFRPRG